MQSVVGVDPGGRYTGVVRLLSGDKLASAVVLRRTTGDDFPDTAYIHEVIDEIAAQAERSDIVAVEGLSEPSSHINGELSIINVKGVMGVAMVYGAVLARWPRAIIVPPGGNGALPDYAYPEPIRKYARLGGPSDHARSAFDVARVGRTMAKALKGATR